MARKLVYVMILALILAGMFGLVFRVQRVEASGTIYIRANGLVEGTDKIVSVDNVTYTFTDNINDSIVVERSNIVVDGAGYMVQGTGTVDSNGIYLSERSNVTIKNVEIELFWYGIYLEDSSNCTVSGNSITNNNLTGIRLHESSNVRISGNTIARNGGGIVLEGRYNVISGNNNVISGNNITNNRYDGIKLYWFSNNNTLSENNVANNDKGILLDDSSNNTISGNTITANNDYGIRLDSSRNNILRGNRMALNKYNLQVSILSFSRLINDIDDSNTVDGKPIYYWINRRNVAVPLNAGYVALLNCTGITVQNQNLTNNWHGALLIFTTNSTIIKSNITKNKHGIELNNSPNNTISGNIIRNNDYGMMSLWSSNNTISGNAVTANNYSVWLSIRSNFNIISGNNITNNRRGITLYDFSEFNIIYGNNITNNDTGIQLVFSRFNEIFHNRFINNTIQAKVRASWETTWDDGYPSGGNFWSNYTDVDEKSGPNQDQPDSDGIWDHPYIIDENNQDNYPIVPEFPTWISLLLMLIVLTVAITIYKRRLLKTPMA